VLGTAILIAIIGDPVSLAEGLSVSDGAYLFAAITSLVAGAVTLTLKPAANPVQVVQRTLPLRGGQSVAPEANR